MTRSPLELAAEYAAAARRLAVGRLRAEIGAYLPGPGARPPRNLLARPRDLRPVDEADGRAVLDGRYTLVGQTLDVGPDGDPWDRPSPSRAFAVELHRFAWLPALAALGPSGAQAAERLVLDWERLFGRPGGFAWTAEVLERRVFNLACSIGPLADAAGDDATRLLGALSRQTARLLASDEAPGRLAERLTVVAVAAAAFDGGAKDGPLRLALSRLAPALRTAVLADGVHRSRSPERGLELLLDLLTLDAALAERGMPSPGAVSGAIDRLRTGTRFFRQSHGGLATFHGGGASTPERVWAALGDAGNRTSGADHAPHGGYQRLNARTLRVLLDTGPPAEGDWSLEATAHALALEVTVGAEPLIRPARGGDAPDDRRTPAGSTATVAGDSLGEVLDGVRALGLGSRLVGGLEAVDVRRSADADHTLWVEVSHSGWVAGHGFLQERRLFVDVNADELRGEDRFTPAAAQPAQTPFAARFHLARGVGAAPAEDGRSVLLVTPRGRRWRLRHDAASAQVEGGAVVLRGHIQPQGGARLRWKLSPEPD